MTRIVAGPPSLPGIRVCKRSISTGHFRLAHTGQLLPDGHIRGEQFGQLMIDGEWAVRDGRSFTWWPHRLAQRVDVSTPRLAFGDPMVAVRVRNDLVSDVRADDDTVADVVAGLNIHASLGAYVWHPKTRRITLNTSAYIHDGNRALERFFGAAVLLGTIEAHSTAHPLADVLDGTAAVTDHPGTGERPTPDDLLAFADNEIAPRGRGPSAFVGPAMAAITRAPSLQGVPANADETGLTAELPFLGATPAMLRAGNGGPIETSLVQFLTAAPHPAYGSGLLVMLRLPLTLPAEQTGRIALALNRAEAVEAEATPAHRGRCQPVDVDERSDREAIASAISRGLDPARIVISANPTSARTPARTAAPTRQKREWSRREQPPATSSGKAADGSARLRIRNGDVDTLRTAGERSLARTEAAARDAKQKPRPDRRCRECQKIKPDVAFPGKRATCVDCGGLPTSDSVRAVSGGLPTGGRRH